MCRYGRRLNMCVRKHQICFSSNSYKQTTKHMKALHLVGHRPRSAHSDRLPDFKIPHPSAHSRAQKQSQKASNVLSLCAHKLHHSEGSTQRRGLVPLIIRMHSLTYVIHKRTTARSTWECCCLRSTYSTPKYRRLSFNLKKYSKGT